MSDQLVLKPAGVHLILADPWSKEWGQPHLFGLLALPASVSADRAGAAAPGGSGPADARAPSDECVPLPVGESYWYAFDYLGRIEYEEAEDEAKVVWIGTQAQVLLDAESDEDAAFQILTEGQVRFWAQGEEYEPVGQGTENDFEPGDLCWCGNFAQPGRYYIVVEHQGSAPSNFKLTVNGEDVTFPPGATQRMTGPEPVAEQAAAVKVPQPMPKASTGPEDALAPNDMWMAIPAGGSYWYAFDCLGHHEYEEAEEEEEEEEEAKAIWVGTQVHALLDAEPDGGVTFKIVTPEQVRLWAQGEEQEPVSLGTENEFAPGDLCWCGNFAGPGRYYIVIENPGSAPGAFKLTVNGEDISF